MLSWFVLLVCWALITRRQSSSLGGTDRADIVAGKIGDGKAGAQLWETLRMTLVNTVEMEDGIEQAA
jgi:hypothetical protein